MAKKYPHNKVKNQPAAGCITLHDSATVSVQEGHALSRGLLRTALALLGACSSFAMLFGFMTVPIHMGIFYTCFVICTLFFSEMALIRHRAVVFCNTLAIMLLLIVLLRHSREVSIAIMELIRFLSAAVQEKDYEPTRLPYDEPYSIAKYLTFGFCLFGFLVSLVVTLLTVYRPRAFMAVALLYAFLGVGLFNGQHTNSMAVFCWIAYLVGMFVITDSYNRFEYRKTEGHTFSYRGNQLIAKPNRRLMRTEAVAWLLAIAVILMGACSCAVTKNESLIASAHDLRMSVRGKWKHMVDAITNSSDAEYFPEHSISENKQHTATMLANRGNPIFNDETVFSVGIESTEQLECLYLKTGTYSVYSGTDWEQLPQKNYDIWSESLTVMQRNRCVPQAPLSEENAVEPIANIWFTHIEPYPTTYRMLYHHTMFQYEYDFVVRENYEHGYPKCQIEQQFLSNSDALFSSVSYPTATAQDFYFSNDSSLEIEEAWKRYDSFVRENDLQLPCSADMDAIRNDASALFSRSYNDTAEALHAIRAYIHSKAEYSLTPVVIDEQHDFASAFLLETGEGYCVHYATAGVLLCRMMGIPARFATGYVLFGSDIEANCVQYDTTSPESIAKTLPTDIGVSFADLQAESNLYFIDVLDSNSHAWTEVYLPGYGWMPFEFTESGTSEDSSNTQGTSDTTSSVITTTSSSVSSMATSISSAASSQSTATTSATQSGSIVTVSREQSVWKKTLCIIALILLCNVGSLGLYLLVHHVVYIRREQKLTHAAPNLAAGAAYVLLLKVLAFAGVTRQPQQSHEAFARMAERICPYLPEGAMQRAVEIQMAAAFSRNGVTQDEVTEQIDFVHALIRTMYQKMPFCKRFAMRWIHHWIP